MPVRLLVASRTSKIVWGQVPPRELCSNRLLSAKVVVDIGTSVPFTACDEEELPVAHGLPSSTDNRRFTASFDSDERKLTPTYLGQGIYKAAVQVGTHGTHSLSVELNGNAAAASLSMQAVCPDVGRTVQLPGGETLLVSYLGPQYDIGLLQDTGEENVSERFKFP